MKPSEYIKKGWCQNSFAALADGTATHTRDPKASAWCAVAAIMVSVMFTRPHAEWVGKSFAEVQNSIINSLCEHLKLTALSPLQWNDAPERTQEEVVAALEAIGY